MSTGGAAGRLPTAWLKSSVFAVALMAAPAVYPSLALATTDRTEYAAQVNPICAAANAQDRQLSERAEEELRRIHQQVKVATGRKRQKLLALDKKLSSALPGQHLGIRYSELARLRAVPAAPGDEGQVASWLAGRRESLDLTSKANSIDRQVERLFKRLKTRDLEELDRVERRIRALDNQASQLNNKVFSLESQSDELGTLLGATDCVSDLS